MKKQGLKSINVIINRNTNKKQKSTPIVYSSLGVLSLLFHKHFTKQNNI